MDAGTVGARVASSVAAPLVKKLFVQEGSGAGLVDKPVRVSGLVSFTGEKRTLTAKDLRKIAEELVRRAARDTGPHDALPEAELAPVTEQTLLTLHALGDLGLSDVEAVQLGHEELARKLAEQAGRRRSPLELGPGQTALYHRVLDTACLHILHFFTQRSPFVARTLVEQSRQLAETVTKLDVLLDRVPSLSAQDAEFEERYARHIAKKHSRLTIYGIDLQQSREWPLDTAYLSLESTAATGVPSPEDAYSAAPEAPQPVEQALAGHPRVLLRGTAGSGKTTLVQWLAVTTARQEALTARFTHLMGRVPFVLPLRTLTRAGARLPAPADFLSAVTSPLSGSQPPGWADRVLTSGRGVLLVDGIDEVPADERERTRRWLRDLISAFPDNLVLVTSRPSAVREAWLDTDDFTELSLSPMRPKDVEVFVQRWHEAAEVDAGLAGDLLAAVRSKPDLARLATNPLMCGLICALHRERRGFLPRGRKALYDAALSMLLERRDREREMHRPDGIEMDEESQVELLQRLAYWLIRNGRSEMEHTDARELLRRELPAMQYVAEQGTPDEIFQHLLVRSGLLREPGPETVDFVHRTFQDHLGAKAAVEERDFPLLVRNAHLDQWEDVLRMAVAHARPAERARLLRELVARGDEEAEHRHRLHLLAMACLEHATNLDPAVRADVESRAKALIPPRSDDEAQELAQVGPVVLELLPEGPDGLEDDEVFAVVRTALKLGGEAALELLSGYRTSPIALSYLGGSWHRFEPEDYADRVVRHLIGDRRAEITVSTDDHFRLLRRMPKHPCLTVHGSFGPEQITELLDERGTERLWLSDNQSLNDLDFLRPYEGIEQVDLRRCPHIGDLSPLAGLPLRKLWLWDFGTQADGLRRGLSELAELTMLVLRGDTVWPGFGQLPRSGALRSLYFPRAGVGSLDPIADFPSLTEVNLFGVERSLTGGDWQALAALPRLERLVLDAPQPAHSFPPWPLLPSLPELILHLSPEPFDLRGLPERFPGLRYLTLGGRSSTVDLAPLAGMERLERVGVNSADRILHADRLAENVTLDINPRPRTNPTP